MAMKLEKLLARAMELTSEEREHLLDLLLASVGKQVRDSESTYRVQRGPIEMTHVTIVLPDDLAEQARAAGLLGTSALEDLLRRALVEQSAAGPLSKGAARRLVRKHGRLIVESLPGEPPMTDDEVRRLLNKMEW